MHFQQRALFRATTRRIALYSSTLALVFAVIGPTLTPSTAAAPVDNDAFRSVWARTDLPVAELETARTWMWGPEGYSGLLTEDYADAPGGERVVQYFDKSRMEINDPSGERSDPWYVTNGLLARDLLLGQVQVGDNAFDEYEPAEINVAGDYDDADGPTYQTFHGVLGADPLPEGSVVDQTIDRDGNVRSDESLADYGVIAEHFEPASNHTVASVFWDFMNRTDQVFQGGEYVEGRLFENPYFATGYPLTEPYWSTVRVAGEPKEVLMQVFERRVLTYTPDNPDGWKVESGNVGLHYYHWYYDILSGHTPEDPDEPREPVSPDEPTEPTPSEPAGDEAACLNEFEQEFLSLINEYRQGEGLSQLENSETLNVSSHNHSVDMGERDYFNHVTPEGMEPWDRMADAGYEYNTKMAENIAAGHSTAQQAFDAWQDSPGHNRTMLDPDLDAIGVGRAEVPDSRYGVYWTTNFGGHVDAAPSC